MFLAFNPILRRVAAVAVLASLQAACGSGAVSAGSVPPAPDAQLEVRAFAVGQSGFGNYLAGRHAQLKQQTGPAAQYYFQALQADPDNLELLQSAFALMAAEGRLTEAAALAERLLAYEPEGGLPAVLLAQRDMKQGRFEAAEKRMAALPRRGINSFLVPLVTAWARAGQGRTDAALEALAPMKDSGVLAPLYHFHAALIADLADRKDLAAENYRNTMAGQGGMTLRTVEAAGSFFTRAGQPEVAQRVYATYLAQHPDSTLLTKPPATRPVPDAKAGLAEAFFGTATSIQQGSAAEVALIFGHLALDLQPKFPLAQLMMADTLQQMNRLEDANAMFGAIDPENPVAYAARLRMANNQDDLGDTDGSVATLRELSQRWPDRADAPVVLGDVLRKAKRFGDAADAYGEALQRVGKVEQRHWSILYSRGISFERAQMWDKAEADLLKALELAPDQPYVLNYLGYSWVEKGINLDKARRMIERAVELRPNDGYIVDSLGWVLFRLGDVEKAVKQMERAVELRPEDPTINDHLGDVLWAVGRHDEARFQWQRALTLQPEPEDIPAIEAKIKNDPVTAQTAPGQ